MLHVDVLARDLFRDVVATDTLANQFVLCDLLLRRRASERNVQRLVAGEFSIRYACIESSWAGHYST